MTNQVMTDIAQKWNKIHLNQDLGKCAAPMQEAAASTVLQENRHLLPDTGCALDLACGLGGNALLLARQGLQTSAWDISRAAIDTLQIQAGQSGLHVRTQVRDVEQRPPEPESFDVIVASHFLHRPTVPDLIAALRPGGLLMYQTFTRHKALPGGPNNPDYLLEQGELLSLFAALRPRVYREEASLGDVGQGLRNQALLVASKPES